MVHGWLSDAEQELVKEDISETEGAMAVETVKRQFQEHEEFMISLVREI